MNLKKYLPCFQKVVEWSDTIIVIIKRHMHSVRKEQVMVKKNTGIKACIAIIFLFCIQINSNTQADEGCFGGFSSISCGGVTGNRYSYLG